MPIAFPVFALVLPVFKELSYPRSPPDAEKTRGRRQGALD